MLHSLASPTNIRLGWKGFPEANTSFLRKSVNYGHKKFYSASPGSHNPSRVEHLSCWHRPQIIKQKNYPGTNTAAFSQERKKFCNTETCTFRRKSEASLTRLHCFLKKSPSGLRCFTPGENTSGLNLFSRGKNYHYVEPRKSN